MMKGKIVLIRMPFHYYLCSPIDCEGTKSLHDRFVWNRGRWKNARKNLVGTLWINKSMKTVLEYKMLKFSSSLCVRESDLVVFSSLDQVIDLYTVFFIFLVFPGAFWYFLWYSIVSSWNSTLCKQFIILIFQTINSSPGGLFCYLIFREVFL